MGLDTRGPDGFRLRPDGQPLVIPISFWPGEGGPQKRSVTELAKAHWEAVGIKIDVRELERSSYLQVLRQACDFDMTLWHAGFMSDPLVILNPWHIVPTTWESGAVLWTEWYNTDGQSGEEPPEFVQRMFELWDIMNSIDQGEVTQAGRELLEIYIDPLFSIGMVGLTPWPILAKENLRNIPEHGLTGWDWTYLSRYQPEQFYFEP